MAAKKKAKPKKKAAKKAVKKSARKPIKKKVAKKAAKKPSKKAVKKTTKKVAKKPIKRATKKVAATKPIAAKPMAEKPEAPKAPSTRPVGFVLDAPYGWDVALAGSFNSWVPQTMVKEADGLWRLTVYLAPGTYQYRFLVDNEWKEDPGNTQRVPNEYGSYNSVVVVS